MKAVLYVSKASQPFSIEALNDLLAQAQQRNQSLNITGYLYYHAPHFFQYIESESGEVDEIMGSITADERHKVINVLEETFTGARRFPDWSMHFVSFDQMQGLTLEEMVVEDLLSLGKVYQDKGAWKETLFNLMRTIARNRNKLAS